MNGILPSGVRKAESGAEVLREGAACPFPIWKGVGERCKLPHRGPEQIPGR